MVSAERERLRQEGGYDRQRQSNIAAYPACTIDAIAAHDLQIPGCHLECRNPPLRAPDRWKLIRIRERDSHQTEYLQKEGAFPGTYYYLGCGARSDQQIVEEERIGKDHFDRSDLPSVARDSQLEAARQEPLRASTVCLLFRWL